LAGANEEGPRLGEDPSAVPNDSCIACRANRGQLNAPGGVIYHDELWQLEHILEPIPLAGWLVLKPLRHVEAFGELTAAEAIGFGLIARRATRAMQQVLFSTKIYVVLFAEAPNAAHIHFHLIPRFAETPEGQRGPNVFNLLRDASIQGRNLGSVAAAQQIAAAIRERLTLIS
jgi:diadenosine tetraphosphate (Ap4A) HIT family hydrolase